MPFFDADQFSLELETSDDQGPSFIGGTLYGKAIIRNSSSSTKSIATRCIILKYFVVEKISNRAEGNVGQPVKPNELKNVNGITLFEMEILLMGSRHGAPVEVHPGTYMYPFEIPLPQSLPPTLKATNLGTSNLGRNFSASIHHYVSLKVMIPLGYKDKMKTFEVSILRAAHPEAIVNQSPDVRYQGGPILACMTCCPSLPKCCPGFFQLDPGSNAVVNTPTDFILSVTNPILSLEDGNNCVIQYALSTQGAVSGYNGPVLPFFYENPGNPLRAWSLDRSCHLELVMQVVISSNPTAPEISETSISSICIGNRQLCAGFIPFPISTGGHFPCSTTSRYLRIRYYLVVRFYQSNGCEQSCCCLGVAKREEARVPIDVFHLTHERAPLASRGQVVNIDLHYSQGGRRLPSQQATITTTDEFSQISPPASQPPMGAPIFGLVAETPTQEPGAMQTPDHYAGSTGGTVLAVPLAMVPAGQMVPMYAYAPPMGHQYTPAGAISEQGLQTMYPQQQPPAPVVQRADERSEEVAVSVAENLAVK